MERASLRQQSVLDRLQRDLEGLPRSPSPWVKELYSSIGSDGLAKCLHHVTEARKNKEEASMIIGLFLEGTLTNLIKYLLTL